MAPIRLERKRTPSALPPAVPEHGMLPVAPDAWPPPRTTAARGASPAAIPTPAAASKAAAQETQAPSLAVPSAPAEASKPIEPARAVESTPAIVMAFDADLYLRQALAEHGGIVTHGKDDGACPGLLS